MGLIFLYWKYTPPSFMLFISLAGHLWSAFGVPCRFSSTVSWHSEKGAFKQLLFMYRPKTGSSFLEQFNPLLSAWEEFGRILTF